MAKPKISRRPRHVTREAVLAALAEYDKLGQERFLEKYGYGPAREYVLWHNGKPYDSKAIAGAAYGFLPHRPKPLRSDEFSGGITRVVSVMERLGFSFEPPNQPKSEKAKKNPTWTRDQLILALDLYTRHNGTALDPTHPEVIALSKLINELADEKGDSTFRNANGVSMKLMNFRSLDPAFTSKGGKGFQRRGKLDEAIWEEFSSRPVELALAAEAIKAGSKQGDDDEGGNDEANDYQAKEGKVSYRKHRTLERNRKIVVLKKEAALKKHGKLECEVCSFDFLAVYGARGQGFIEAHHTNPVHAMKDGDLTIMEDLALVCPNCHRMIHKAKPWLSIAELKKLLQPQK